MASKVCFKCQKEKPLGDFYKHPCMADGYLNKCKACAKLDSRAHRERNIDAIREYDRARSELPHRREAALLIVKRYEEQFPHRRKANTAVHNAVRDGRVVKWPVCAVPDCSHQRVVAHHPDYSRPLDVVWLCQSHHKQAHALIHDQ